ncbi:MAG: RagB/SusD family nutrient uptake outer membrane protein [Saprospiraceae bacterium]|nr:RagB/SusD family nutrient uptake outer membrane protein [Saprospiraceae bacterium]
MKQHKLFIFILLAALFPSACQKDFLDRKPIIGATEENFYRTEADAIAAVNAAYAPLQFETTTNGGGPHFRWFWGDVMSDDAIKGGSGDNDGNEILQLETFRGPSNTTHLENEWAADYQGIYRANVVLERVPGIEMNAALKTRILGEAYFIRAWFFYNLVTIYGGVPLADHVLAPSEYNLPRADAAQVWALIESDLKTAASSLPLRSGYAQDDLGRITKGAAQALLAKSYLWQKRWAEAEAVANEVVLSNEYQLVTDYASIFTLAGENNAESVFEIQYMNASGGNYDAGANEGSFTPVYQRARGQFEGYGFNLPTEDFVQEFFKEGFEDPRLRSTVFRVGDAMGDRGIFTKEATGGYAHDYYPKKYFAYKSEDAPFGDVNVNGGVNDRVIRYSDVLLMHAEAAAQNANEDGARTSLNLVRKRARGNTPGILPDVTASGQALLDAIYRERRIELGLEGHRFFDLVRTGRAQTALGPLGYLEGTHNLFPIPQSQVQATNGAIRQNPGYN